MTHLERERLAFAAFASNTVPDAICSSTPTRLRRCEASRGLMPYKRSVVLQSASREAHRSRRKMGFGVSLERKQATTDTCCRCGNLGATSNMRVVLTPEGRKHACRPCVGAEAKA